MEARISDLESPISDLDDIQDSRFELRDSRFFRRRRNIERQVRGGGTSVRETPNAKRETAERRKWRSNKGRLRGKEAEALPPSHNIERDRAGSSGIERDRKGAIVPEVRGGGTSARETPNAKRETAERRSSMPTNVLVLPLLGDRARCRSMPLDADDERSPVFSRLLLKLHFCNVGVSLVRGYVG